MNNICGDINQGLLSLDINHSIYYQAIRRSINFKMSKSKYIEFQDVHFKYTQDNNVLKGVNMQIDKGNNFFDFLKYNIEINIILIIICN